MSSAKYLPTFRSIYFFTFTIRDSKEGDLENEGKKIFRNVCNK